ncbi:hypothetical protein KFV02_00805 [Desulfohalobiaceae bacterium Ax17]|uniref:hypothetical protein n=1 Tax=Desulfovulcanus ferrireducens TaxID=2831190 RepID=UPI00207BC673|nr:hypothetical protein [Desulfovulcanus ferrireducens]MBT8762471.1 hypothetical protein [Desulfovulcanus ferrireducens]
MENVLLIVESKELEIWHDVHFYFEENESKAFYKEWKNIQDKEVEGRIKDLIIKAKELIGLAEELSKDLKNDEFITLKRNEVFLSK